MLAQFHDLQSLYNMLVTLTLAALIGLSASITVDDCPTGVARNAYLKVFGNSCYEFVLRRFRDHTEAGVECKRYGGTLAMVKSQDVQNFLFNELTKTYHKQGEVWIGLSDSVKEGDWIWSDGTALDYSNWANGEGPVEGTNELQDCAVIDTSDLGQWHDYHCENEVFGLFNYEKAYVCEYVVGGAATAATA